MHDEPEERQLRGREELQLLGVRHARVRRELALQASGGREASLGEEEGGPEAAGVLGAAANSVRAEGETP